MKAASCGGKGAERDDRLAAEHVGRSQSKRAEHVGHAQDAHDPARFL